MKIHLTDDEKTKLSVLNQNLELGVSPGEIDSVSGVRKIVLAAIRLPLIDLHDMLISRRSLRIIWSKSFGFRHYLRSFPEPLEVQQCSFDFI